MDTTASHAHVEPPAPPIADHYAPHHHYDHHDHNDHHDHSDHHHHDHYHHHRHDHHHDPYSDPLPNYPPPSYDDATGSATAPLLVGPPPGYGAFGVFAGADDSSIESSDIEGGDRTLPEWLGQLFVVLVFIAIMYAFFRVINAADSLDDSPG